MWEDLPEDDIRNTIKFLMKGEENVTTFVSYDRFLEKMEIEDTIPHRDFYYKCNNVFFMYMWKWNWIKNSEKVKNDYFEVYWGYPWQI